MPEAARRKQSAWGPAAVASIAAGPIYVVALTFSGVFQLAGQDPYWRPQILEMLSLLLPSFIVGFLLAIVPNLLGTMAMTALSRRSDEARHPAAWVAAGAFSGAALAFLFGARFDPDGLGAISALAVTGGACAGICRLRVRLD